MKTTAIKTSKIIDNSKTIFEILDKALPQIEDSSVVAVTSKIISICEGRTVPFSKTTKEELILAESDLYLPASLSKYGHHFTITNNTLIPVAGVDESNGDGCYILWPEDSQKTANDIRAYLKQKHGIEKLGVVITDSTCHPLRRGTTGIALAHSGFFGLKNYVGKPDLFGRPFSVSQANHAEGLAATAVLAMGEGTEQTPVCIVSEMSFLVFNSEDPSEEEIKEINIPLEEDLFAPFLESVEWKKGKGGRANGRVS